MKDKVTKSFNSENLYILYLLVGILAAGMAIYFYYTSTTKPATNPTAGPPAGGNSVYGPLPAASVSGTIPYLVAAPAATGAGDPAAQSYFNNQQTNQLGN
jgi:hypothetical protein